MREKLNHLYLDSHERILLLHSLVELKNQIVSIVFRKFNFCRSAAVS